MDHGLRFGKVYLTDGKSLDIFGRGDINIKKITSILGKEFLIEIAKGLAKKFKLKSFFQEIYSLVIDKK